MGIIKVGTITVKKAIGEQFSNTPGKIIMGNEDYGDIIRTDTYSEWLKSYGCTFFAPLDNGELYERIHGVTGIVQYNNSAVWDAQENAFLFTKDSAYEPAQSIVNFRGVNNGMDITNIGVTYMYEIKVIKNGDDANGNANSTTPIPIVLGGRTYALNLSGFNVNRNTWYKLAYSIAKYTSGSRNSYWYQNGVQVYQYNRGTTKITGNELTNSETDINYCINRAYTNCKFYMRNAMIFNRALSRDEVRIIQKIS